VNLNLTLTLSYSDKANSTGFTCLNHEIYLRVSNLTAINQAPGSSGPPMELLNFYFFFNLVHDLFFLKVQYYS
jgi:hypothetical protein